MHERRRADRARASGRRLRWIALVVLVVLARGRRRRSAGTSSSARSRSPTGFDDRRDALQVRLDRRRERRRHPVLDLLRAAAHVPRQAARARAATPRSAWRGSRGRSCRSASPRRRSASRASPTTAPSATPRAIAASRDENPTFVVAGPGHTLNVEAFFRFLVDCAQGPALQRRQPDARDQPGHRPVAGSTALIYRFLHHPHHQEAPARARGAVRVDLPPRLPRLGTRARRRHEPHQVLHDQAGRWTTRFGPTDMPSIWNLKKYQPRRARRMNWAGDSHDPYSVSSTRRSACSAPRRTTSTTFSARCSGCMDYLRRTAAAEVSRSPIDATLRRRGQGGVRRELRELPRQRHDRHARAAGRGRHRPRPARYLEQGGGDRGQQGRRATWASSARAWSKRRSSGYNAAVPRRHLAARAVSAQRLGADPARSAARRRRSGPRCSGAATTSTTR